MPRVSGLKMLDSLLWFIIFYTGNYIVFLKDDEGNNNNFRSGVVYWNGTAQVIHGNRCVGEGWVGVILWLRKCRQLECLLSFRRIEKREAKGCSQKRRTTNNTYLSLNANSSLVETHYHGNPALRHSEKSL